MSSLNATFDVDAFVHASEEGFGNAAPMHTDTGAIDIDAISQVAHVTQGAGKLTRKEKKRAKREMKKKKREAKKAEKQAKQAYSSVKSQLKDRDKELSDKMADARKKRDSAKDVVNYIGYNKMYQDGICEVEEGMFSSSIAFDDTSYHSVRDEQQKAMFSAITRLYDQFGADTLVQMSVINTPLLKEEVGHRKFFDPERQANDAARNDAQVFNNILNDKVKEGVSNIRRNRYLTYSVTADTAEDAARQLSRIEVESSRILNSIGSKAHLMNGTQRLSVIHSLLNPYKPFLFDYQRDISAKRIFVPSGRYGALMFIRDAARIPTMPPRNPRKKNPTFWLPVSSRSIVMSIWSFRESLASICFLSFAVTKSGRGAFAPVPEPCPR